MFVRKSLVCNEIKVSFKLSGKNVSFEITIQTLDYVWGLVIFQKEKCYYFFSIPLEHLF